MAELLVSLMYKGSWLLNCLKRATDALRACIDFVLGWTARGPWLAIVAAIAPIIAGVSASLAADDLRNLTQLFSGERLVNGTFIIFVVAVVFTGLSFGVAQMNQAKTARTLLEVTRRLETLPPRGFVGAYQQHFRAALKPVLGIVFSEERPSSKKVEAAVRILLRTVLDVVKHIDPVEGATYGVNVMQWTPRNESFVHPTPIHLIPIVQGQPATRGHLELLVGMSVTSSREFSDEDSTAKPLTIPVPEDTKIVRDPKGKPRRPTLPGAPQAFLNKSVVSFESMDDFHDWLDHQLAADPSVIFALKDYFDGENDSIQSFASLAILPPIPNMEDVPLGVLNIQSSREGVLRDNGQKLFGALLDPFLALLAILLVQWKNALVEERTRTEKEQTNESHHVRKPLRSEVTGNGAGGEPPARP